MHLKNNIDSIEGILNCPSCETDLKVDIENLKLRCSNCMSDYLIKDGIIDFLPTYKGASGLSQKAMENPFISKIYENYFRPLFCLFGTSLKYDDEVNWLLDTNISKPKVVVDLACGSAKYGRLLSKTYNPDFVICIDLSMSMLKEAKRRIEQDGLTNVILIRASIDRLPIKSNTIDWLNCFGALHLFPDTTAAFKEINRVLSYGSIFTCLTACLPKSHKLPLLPKLVLGKSDFKFLSKKELLGKLQQIGFQTDSTLQEKMILMFKSTKIKTSIRLQPLKTLTVEKYNPTDKNDCIEVFKSNIPGFFSKQELTDFKNWLDKNDCPDFYILRDKGQTIGFGGFYFKNGQARLVYGIIDRQHQNAGYGKFLTDHRINKIREKDRGIPIGLETTPLTNKFFEKFGFKTIEITPNYYYDRFDKYEMILQSNIDKEDN